MGAEQITYCECGNELPAKLNPGGPLKKVCRDCLLEKTRERNRSRYARVQKRVVSIKDRCTRPGCNNIKRPGNRFFCETCWVGASDEVEYHTYF